MRYDQMEVFTNENGEFSWGIETAVNALRPGCLYSLSASDGNFQLLDFPENQWSEELEISPCIQIKFCIHHPLSCNSKVSHL